MVQLFVWLQLTELFLYATHMVEREKSQKLQAASFHAHRLEY